MFFPFLVVESTDELNEKDLIWSKKNLEETAQVDYGSAPNEPPKKRSRLVSLVNLYDQYYSDFVRLPDYDVLFSDVSISYYSRFPITQTFKGNRKKVRVIGSLSYWEFELSEFEENSRE